MPIPHLFEFMDQEWVSSGLRTTLREILECGNARPFRPYYQWVASEVLRAAEAGGYAKVVELGAGTAPITRLLAEGERPGHARLIPCDLNPDVSSYRALEARHPNKVAPEYKPVDFSEPRPWGPDALLFLSATFHHIPPQDRPRVIEALTESSGRVLIFEPLRRTLSSILFVLLSIGPALLLPLWYLGRPGKLRRFLWCWVIPLAAPMFVWDGLVSCLRQWSDGEWKAEIHRLGRGRSADVESSLFSQKVTW